MIDKCIVYISVTMQFQSHRLCEEHLNLHKSCAVKGR